MKVLSQLQLLLPRIHPATPSQFVSMRNKNLILSFYWVLIDFLLCDKNEISAFHSSRIAFWCIYFRLRVNHDVAIDWVLRGARSNLQRIRKGWYCLAQHVIAMFVRFGKERGLRDVITAMKWLIQWSLINWSLTKQVMVFDDVIFLLKSKEICVKVKVLNL